MKNGKAWWSRFAKRGDPEGEIDLLDVEVDADADADADGEEEEGNPFGRGELLPQECDGERGRGKDLHLVRNLERGHGEIADRHKLERVLDDVEERGDGKLPAVGAEHLSADAPEGKEPAGKTEA